MWWHMRRNQISSFARYGRIHLNELAWGVSSVDYWQRRFNAGYPMFRGSVKGTVYPLHSPVYQFTSPPLYHRVPSHFIWTVFAWAYYVTAAKWMAHLSLLSWLEMNGPLPPLPHTPPYSIKTQTGFAFTEYFSVVNGSSVGAHLSPCCYSKHRPDVSPPNKIRNATR